MDITAIIQVRKLFNQSVFLWHNESPKLDAALMSITRLVIYVLFKGNFYFIGIIRAQIKKSQKIQEGLVYLIPELTSQGIKMFFESKYSIKNIFVLQIGEEGRYGVSDMQPFKCVDGDKTKYGNFYFVLI